MSWLPAVLGLPLWVMAGVAVGVLIIWQALTGLKVIKLGRSFAKVHKWSGVAAVVLLVGHIPFGLIALGLFK